MSDISYVSVKQKDEYSTRLARFLSPNKPIASILILHGMAEHANRYYPFAEAMTAQGFDIYLYNHRGHGIDTKINELGYINAKHGDQILVNDAIQVSEYIKQHNRTNKLFLFAHSMGSLIARNILLNYENFQGVILSGTTYPSILKLRLGLLVTSIIKKMKGPKHRSPYISNLLFGSKAFTNLNDRTSFDWLSRKHSIVGAYIHDPYCGFLCTISFYQDLLRLTYNGSRSKNIKKNVITLPLLIISGAKDPVGSYGYEISKLVHTYKKYGYTNVSHKLYSDCRHELLNEINYEDICVDILSWLKKY